MTASPHIDRLREEIIGLRNYGYATVAQDRKAARALKALNALAAELDAARDEAAAQREMREHSDVEADTARKQRDEMRNLASLVSGVLCDAATIVVAPTDDVVGLHAGLRELLKQRDEARRQISHVKTHFNGRCEHLTARAESAEARVAELKAALRAVETYCDNCDKHGGIPSTVTIRQMVARIAAAPADTEEGG